MAHKSGDKFLSTRQLDFETHQLNYLDKPLGFLFSRGIGE